MQYKEIILANYKTQVQLLYTLDYSNEDISSVLMLSEALQVLSPGRCYKSRDRAQSINQPQDASTESSLVLLLFDSFSSQCGC